MPAVRRSPRVALLAVLPLMLLLLLGATACQDSPERPEAAPTDPSTPLASFSTGDLSVQRSAFCSRIAPAQAGALLGAEVASSTSYNNGEPARVTREVKDVAHEFSCSWTATDGTVARAWVFAPPVTVAQARGLARQAQATAGCRPVAEAPRFGRRSVALRCTDGPRLTASYRGLFGDAWLACSLEAPATGDDANALPDRAGRWCVSVAQAASATPAD
jgi:hypothetical protein